MSDTHNKPQYGDNYNHWKMLDLVLDLNRFYFSNQNINHNPTHLTEHSTLSPNHHFSQRILYVEEYHSVHAHMAWSQKFSLTPECKDKIKRMQQLASCLL